MATFTADDDDLLICLLGRQDAVWLPARPYTPRDGRQWWQAQKAFRMHGQALWPATGDAASRKAAERRRSELQTLGILRLVRAGDQNFRRSVDDVR